MPIDKTNKTQSDFLNQICGDVEPFLFLLDMLPDTAAYLKDRKGRIMFLNQWNYANCNVKSVSEAIGKTSYDLFPESCAQDYVDTDDWVMRTGRPIIKEVSASPDLTTKFMCYSKTPLYGKGRKVVGVAAVYHFIKDEHELPEWYGGLSDVAAFINEHYAEPITVKRLADIAHCSTSQFARGFKRLFKMTPIDYIQLTRVNAARELLEHSTRLVSDIAQAVGFYDQSHFSRIFKRFRGLTPHQYRLRHRMGRDTPTDK
jgi:AraC-like DNA-binding protein